MRQGRRSDQGKRGPGNRSAGRASLAFGVISAPFGVAIGIYFGLSAIGAGYEALPITAGLGAFAGSALSWHMLVDRAPRAVHPIWAGAVAGLLSHWCCWYFMILWLNVRFWVLGAPGSSLGEPPVDPVRGLIGVFALCLWSWILAGWLTVPLGILLAQVTRRLYGPRLDHGSEKVRPHTSGDAGDATTPPK